ncbi:hypothetical protein MUY14_43400 [Amycolatopsis sp. FBCC-B4732]|uniref:RNA polymerase sigma factor n=1 Tax=Amycolatopsis sp. FBCC-B4732 TaxID=3079339 RepID=UPI001FF3BE9C|nr:sigma factor-like helix-turn-helix DNA-binding protein [Amycolatopsis sp. FBCC-B4732]UOX88452.1 hypothetical protein MUY14_43400 [Amycolatopsis sp. FBCC-B4732]
MSAAASTPSPEWVRPISIPIADRLLATTYLVLRRSGLRARACRRTCRKALPGLSAEDRPAGRRIRPEDFAALRLRLGRKGRSVRFDAAVDEALLLDAMLSLPPRQRFVVRSAVTGHWSVTDIAAQTGWTRGQVHTLLRAGLKTLATQGAPGGRLTSFSW